jgi:PAS domain S-box-containing protein
MASLLSTLRGWLASPVLETIERTEAAQRVHKLLKLMICIVSLFLIALVVLQPETIRQRSGTFIVFNLSALLLLVMNRLGKTRAASWGIVLVVGGILTIRTLSSGGIHAPATPLYVALVLLAGFLLGERGGTWVGITAGALLFAITLAEIYGILPRSTLNYTPVSLWLYNAMPIALALVLQQMVSRTLGGALERSERELHVRREAEQRLQLALDSGQIAVWHQNARGEQFHTDERMFDFFGIPLNQDGAVPYQLWLERIHVSEREGVARELDRLWSGGRDARAEYRIVRPDGSMRYMLGTGSAVLDEKAGVKRVVGIVVDVTERKQTEEEIRRLNRVYAVLSGINQLIVRERNLKTLFDGACRIAEEKGGFRMAWIGILDAEAKRVTPVAAAGVLEGLWEVAKSELEDVANATGPSAHAMRSGVYQVCNDIRTDELFREWRKPALERGYGSFASFPLKVAGKTVGVFTFVSSEVDFFDAGEIQLLDDLANNFGFALELNQREIERRRAEQSLSASERQFASAFEYAPIGKALVAPDGRWLKVNRALCEMLNYSAAELLAITFQDITHPDDLERDLANLRKLLAGEWESYQIEKRYLRKDGEIIWIDLSVSLVRNERGDPMHFISQIQNVTRRRQAERERETLLHDLKERVKELRLLHQTAQLLQQGRSTIRQLLEEWILLLPAAWQYSECCAARVTYSDIEARTRNWRESKWKLSATIETTDCVGKIEVIYLEARPFAVDGPFLAEERALLTSLAEMLVGYLELRKHRINLESLVVLRTKDLSAAKQEAERANRAKGMFLANISHEIRTPMNAILGYAQILESDPTLGDVQKRKASVIRASGDHLLRLVNDVLEMSRIEAGRTRLVAEPMDLRAMLEEIEQMFAPLAASKRNELAFQFGPGLPPAILGDVGKIRQVVINLLSNAVKFTEAGHIHVKTVVAPSISGDFRFSIVVADGGRGIASKDLSRIFHAFEQTETGFRAGGTGLGLTISQNFARMMGGDLTVTSVLGEGSKFTFSFEAATAREGSLPSSPLRASNLRLATRDLGCKVLVVDDVATNRDVLADLLTRTGFDVQLAADGEEGIRVHDKWNPRLVLMDLRMPGIDGVEAIRRLRAGGSAAILVALTASGVPGSREEVLNAGGNDLILKPYRERELLAHIERLVGVEFAIQEKSVGDDSLKPKKTSTIHSLPNLLKRIPVEYLEPLREAAFEARVERIERLAAQIEPHSREAADQIVLLARDFQYDKLISSVSETLQP